jgi:hypothetical protein
VEELKSIRVMAWKSLRAARLPPWWAGGRQEAVRFALGVVAEGDFGEVDFDFGGVVEIVGEDVEGDVGDDVGDFRVGEAGFTDGFELGVAGTSLSGNDLLGKAEGGGVLWRVGVPFAGGFDFGITEADHFADGGMRGNAVLAGILFADFQGDEFAEFRVEMVGSQSATEREVRLQDGGRVGHDAHHVGRHFEFGVNAFEKLFGFAGSGFGWDGLKSGHRNLLFRASGIGSRVFIRYKEVHGVSEKGV